jgi:hypothetical protein
LDKQHGVSKFPSKGTTVDTTQTRRVEEEGEGEGEGEREREGEMADSLLVPLPTVKNSLSAGRGILEERFSQLSASGDIRSHHPLGVVSPADEEAVMNGIASVIEGIEHFTKLAQVCGISFSHSFAPPTPPQITSQEPLPPSPSGVPPLFPPLSPLHLSPSLHSLSHREAHNAATPDRPLLRPCLPPRPSKASQ